MEGRNKIIKAVIPVAGLGTRLLPATKSQPKEMLPVGRKPAVQYVVEEMQTAGLREILFITGRKKTAIEDHFDMDPELVRLLSAADNYALLETLDYVDTETAFFYTRQSTPLGLADAVRHAEKFVGKEHFVVALGDSIIKSYADSCFLSWLIQAHVESGADCTIALEEVAPEDVYKYGIVEPVKGADLASPFEIENLVEKPSLSTAPSNLAIAARYVFSPAIFEAIRHTVPDRKGELQLTDSIRLLKQQGYRIFGVCLRPGERRYDIGNFESYFTAFIDFALADERYGYMVRQYVKRKAREL